ncbi:MAG: class I SAM-dependent methyltransferase, partial [Myxococcota bacterium]
AGRCPRSSVAGVYAHPRHRWNYGGEMTPSTRDVEDSEPTGVPESIDALTAAQVDVDVRTVDQLILLGLFDLVSSSDAAQREGWTTADLAAELCVVSRHRWVLDRWLQDLIEHGLVDRVSNGYARLDRPSRAQLRTARSAMMQAAARLGHGPVLAMTLLESLRQAPKLLRDEVAVQNLLYPAGGTEFAEDVYGTNAVSRYLNAAAAEQLAAVAHDGPIRVLELGAGIGATTTAVATRGVLLQQYVYSDLSSWFLQLGRLQFEARLPLLTLPLDIDHDFTPQLAEHGVALAFDAVLAATMAHNARDVGQLLKRVHRTLRPGGCLVLIETVQERAQSLTTMPFALSAPADRPEATLDPGSGARRDDVRRETLRTYLTEAEWLAHLSAAGFELQTRMPDPDHPLYPASQRMFAARSAARPKETML